jgi:hypothetical protein
MMRIERILLIGCLLLGSAPRAWATPILFDFNPLSAGINSVTGVDPIETYIESIYGSDVTVNVGAQTRKDRVESRPTGLYLGNSDGALDRGPFVIPPGHADPKDTFLINRWNATSLPLTVGDRIVITFETVPIGSVELDWEIFPVTRNGQTADFTLWADGNIIFFTQLLGLEKELGDLGHFGPFFFTTPVKTLQFVDWNDAPIGIDNLSVNPVPEPGSLLLLGSGLAGWVAWRRAQKHATS